MKIKILPIVIIQLFILMCLTALTSQKVSAKDNVTIVIDPGHGGSDTESDAENGAMYKDELSEKTVNLVTALAMKEELEQYNNVTVYLTRDTDRKISLEGRVAYANSVKADAMICCHYNASETHLFYGAEIFTSAFSKCYATGHGLAECIMSEWEMDGAAVKGIKTRIGKNGNDYYGVIREGASTGLPVIIIEHGYLDNHIDYERLGMEEDWKRIGRLDARGVASYYGLSKENTLTDVYPTVNVDVPEQRVEPDITEPTSVDFEILGYDAENSEVTYRISAIEPDGRLMYYGLALGEPDSIEATDYADLYLWSNEENTVSGNLCVPTTYRGMINARVYNIYELYSDCEPVYIDMATKIEEYNEELRMNAEADNESISISADRTVATYNDVENEEDEGFIFFLGGRKADGKTRTGSERIRALRIVIIAFLIVLVCFAVIIYISFFKRR